MGNLNFLAYPLDDLPFVFLALLIAFTLHEFAHAYFADRFGDPTARHFGRVTLNPMAHLDVLGILLFLLAGFGWAKPVPVDRSRFKNPRLMSIVVSAAGPLSNLLLAFIGVFVFLALLRYGVVSSQHMSRGAYQAVLTFFEYFIKFNALLFIFNLIPLPPLDGYRIIKDFAPLKARIAMSNYEQWGAYIFLLLVFIPPLSAATIQPILGLSYDIVDLFMRISISILGKGADPLAPSGI